MKGPLEGGAAPGASATFSRLDWFANVRTYIMNLEADRPDPPEYVVSRLVSGVNRRTSLDGTKPDATRRDLTTSRFAPRLTDVSYLHTRISIASIGHAQIRV